MRLIDADELIKTYEEETGYTWSAKGILECPKCFIDDAPTVEVTDYDTGYQDGLEDGLNDIRPQGEWEQVLGDYMWDNIYKIAYQCNNCNQQVPIKYPNCPYCLAAMIDANDGSKS